jgi:hypothetical protein
MIKDECSECHRKSKIKTYIMCICLCPDCFRKYKWGNNLRVLDERNKRNN